MSYTTNKSGISRFVERCVSNGLTHVVCSPGSRNAPLVIAFDKHPQIKTFVIHDERVAAFYALGMSIALKKPVGVCCTSGSALTNYFPAVTEAFYQCIPLVVMSADRPEEWINHGDGQTIMQENLFGKHVHKYLSVPEEVAEIKTFDELIDGAFESLYDPWTGPIHFNFPLNEPLYSTVDKDFEFISEQIERKQAFAISKEETEYISEIWNASTRKMILCGQMNDVDQLQNVLVDLADDSGLVVLVENTSNLVDKRFVHCIDRTLVAIGEDEIEGFYPDLLITLGDAVISKKIKAFLRKSKAVHWKVGVEFPEMDTYRLLQKSFAVNPDFFISRLLELDLQRNRSNYGAKWRSRDLMVKDAVPDFLDAIKFCDLYVFDQILQHLPENSYLHMGNSSVVRYCQLFDPVSSVRYFSNRGTSGIDGSLSTASGCALVSKDKLNVMITGDISFFYDSNALWNNYKIENLVIILINNGGGGIFRIIDGPNTTDQLESYFEASHSFHAKGICESFGVSYIKAQNASELENGIGIAFGVSENRPRLLEVVTKDIDNENVLKEFFKMISEQCVIKTS